jgi:hypothetical protein
LLLTTAIYINDDEDTEGNAGSNTITGSAHFSLLTSKTMMMKIRKQAAINAIKDLLTSIEKGGGAGTQSQSAILCIDSYAGVHSK